MKIGLKAKSGKAALVLSAAAVLLAAPAPGAAQAAARPEAAAFAERAFVLAADARCRLFTAPVRAALAAAERQARGAALRAGTRTADLEAAERQARARAASVSCDAAELAQLRARVAHAFSGWARTPRMAFPGDRSEWRVERAARDSSVWRLRQASMTGASPVVFGQVDGWTDGDAVAVVSFVGRPRPIAARVILRDAERAPRPWLAADGALPPPSLTRAVWAVGWSPAAPSLLEPGRRQGEAWRFPGELAAALENLDPRESFAVEFLFRDDSVTRAVFEAGDFAAARAFLGLGAP